MAVERAVTPSYNPVRRACIQAVESRWFANTTMAFIILNSLSMGLADYSKVDPETMELATEGSYRNQVNSGILEPVFIAVFSIECVIKVIAMGFVWGKDSYLRDPWNRLGACAGRPAWNADNTVPRLTASCCTAATPGTDFIVVASALLELIPGFPGLRYLRSFRLLRPLRTISHFPTMRAMVAALMASIPALSCVVGILFFVFAVWCAQCMLDNSLVETLARSHLLTTDRACSHRGILALQFWGRNGDLTGRCRLTPFPVKLAGARGSRAGPLPHQPYWHGCCLRQQPHGTMQRRGERRRELDQGVLAMGCAAAVRVANRPGGLPAVCAGRAPAGRPPMHRRQDLRLQL